MPPRLLSLKRALLVIFCLALFVLLVQFQSPNLSDPDAFYHMRHSWIYRTSGIFDSSFPWAQYSSIKEIGSDIWYGFHLVIMPLTYFQDLAGILKWGSSLVMLISLLIAFSAFKKLGMRWPLFWTLLFSLITADLLYRLTMLRPHSISISLTFLLFAFFADKPSYRTSVAIFFLGAAFSWLHLSLSWIPVLMAGALAISQFFKKIDIEWRKILALIAGLAVGWLARPNPFGGLKLAYIQVLKLLIEKQNGLPLRFGNELKPFVWVNFVDILIPISVLMLAAIILFLWMLNRKPAVLIAAQTQAVLWASLALSVLFFVLSFLLARRSSEFFVGFGIIFIGLVVTRYWNLPPETRRSFFAGWPMSLLGLAVIAALIYGPIKTVYRYETYFANTGSFFPTRFKETSLWLQEHSQPGEIVFNLQWDRFAQLFFWNQHNYYINGMDPIFEFDYSPELYWKNHHLYIDKFFIQDGVAKVCGEIRCTEEMVEDVHKILKDDFKASYVFIERRRNPRFYEYLKQDNRFRQDFENDFEAVFKIL